MFIVEVTRPYAPDDHLDERWHCPDVETAALRFHSEVDPVNWSVEEVAEMLDEVGEAECRDDERGLIITAQRLPR